MYDAGTEVTNSFLALHRNENQYVSDSWLRCLAEEASSRIQFSSYPDSRALRLRQAIATFHQVDVDEVFVGNGADGVLADILQLLRDQHQFICAPQITYRVYPYLFKRYGYSQVPLDSGQAFLHIIDSPNSLSGECFDFTSIHPRFLIHDNVYGEFAKETISRKLFGPTRCIVRSFSKFYALANLRIGYCIGESSWIGQLMSRKDVFNISGFAQEMALLALENHEYFASFLEELESAKNILRSELTQIGFMVSDSKSNFLWISHPSYSSEQIQTKLKDKGILVRHFNEPILKGYVRMTVPRLEHIPLLLEILRLL